MAVRLTSDITIGNFRFSGVHTLRIKRSLHSWVDMAYLTLPSTCRITRKNGKQDPGIVQTANQFADGDKVVIKIGYDGANVTEFEGFVRRRNLNHPLEIEMEGYSWQLRRKPFSGYWKEIKLADLLAKATEGTDITVRCDADMMLYGIRITEGSAIDVLDAIKKASNQSVSLFFLTPKTLYAGLLYTAYASGNDKLALGSAKYRIGYNCPYDNNLRQRIPENDPVIVHYVKRNAKGQKLSAKSSGVKEYNNRIVKKVLNHIGNETDLQQLADEKENSLNYTGLEGSLTGFGIPHVQPGYVVQIVKTLNPEYNGSYLVDGIDIRFGVRGYRRDVEVQHKL